MKKIFPLILLLIFTSQAFAKSTEIPGTVVKRNGSTEEVTLLISATKKAVNMVNLRDEVKYLNKDGKKAKFKASQLKEVHFEYKGEKIDLIAKSVPINKKKSERIFLHKVREGKMTLYKAYQRPRGNGSKVGSLGPVSLSVSTQKNFKYYVQKTKRTLKYIRFMQLRKDISTQLYDCPDLKKKVQDNKWAAKHKLEEIVDIYNETCGE